MSKEKIYPKGLITFKPHEKAADFVLGKLVITLNDLIKFCKDNPELLTEYKGQKQLPLNITEGKYGISFDVDTWKPDNKQTKDESFEDVSDLGF